MTGLAELGIRLRSTQPGTYRAACPECARYKARRSDFALSVTVTDDGAAFWHCFRCDWRGSTRHRTDRPRAPRRQPPDPVPRAKPRHTTLAPAWRRFWSDCRPIEAGTVAGRYLERRGCILPTVDPDLRWHPKHPHPGGHVGPILVALITDALTNEPISLHRTWIAPDGTSKAEIDRPRMLLPGHRKAAGVIRLCDDAEVNLGLAVAEGIESALAFAHALAPIWALVDAGNLAAFPVLPGIECLTIAADHDRAGLDSAEACATRWSDAGKEVRLWDPDFGDAADFVTTRAAA